MLLFTTPWAFLLLALLPTTAIAGYARVRRLPRGRGPLALGLRLLVLALLVAALAGPRWRSSQSRVAVVFLVDASASVGAAGQHAGMTWAARAVTAGGPRDQAGLILFGAAPRLAVPLAHYRTLPDPAGEPDAATDVAAAARLGLALLPPDIPGRLVLLSDGRATTGDIDGALAQALSRGVPIDTVAIAPPTRRDTLVRAINLPRTVRVGERAPLRITLRSNYATDALLTVTLDGVPTQRTIRLAAGDTVLEAEQRIDTPGVHTVHVRVDAPGDALPRNNALDATTVAGPPGRVLFVVVDPAAATRLATTLASARLAIVPTLAAALPATAAGYRSYDAVVLDDVAATALRTAQQRALRTAVYDDGLGLVAIGGPTSFGDGAYAHTPLEDILPVYSIAIPRRLSVPLALELIIDKSGSMSDTVDGVAKVDMVKKAAASALDRLGDGDAVGVLAFDDTTHVIVPFHALQGAADKAGIRGQIAALSADGSTTIYPALQQAERDVVRVPTIYRHVVLLTDGQGEQDAPFDMLIRRMRREHITLSTIGVGQDVVQDELKHWAKLGGGLFHYVSDPHDIPRIVVDETRYGVAGTAEVQGHIRLGVAASSPLLRALSGHALPAITGYDSAAPKATAQVDVQSASGDPVLSSWQYGLGRAVAWTSDAGGAWAGSWNPSRLPDFWIDMLHWAMRGYAPDAGTPSLVARDGVLHVSLPRYDAAGGFDDTASPLVRVASSGGVGQVVPLVLAGPGLYTADLPLSEPGVYTAVPLAGARNAPVASETAALAVPYPAEYADDGVDTAVLAHLAEASGGQTLTRPADAFSHAGLAPTTVWQPLWPLLLLLALLLVPVDVAVRLLVRPDPVYLRRA